MGFNVGYSSYNGDKIEAMIMGVCQLGSNPFPKMLKYS